MVPFMVFNLRFITTIIIIHSIKVFGICYIMTEIMYICICYIFKDCNVTASVTAIVVNNLNYISFLTEHHPCAMCNCNQFSIRWVGGIIYLDSLLRKGFISTFKEEKNITNKHNSTWIVLFCCYYLQFKRKLQTPKTNENY